MLEKTPLYWATLTLCYTSADSQKTLLGHFILEFQLARGSGSEWSRERKGPGVKVPGSKLARVLLADSLLGANWPGSEKAVNLFIATIVQIKISTHVELVKHGL